MPAAVWKGTISFGLVTIPIGVYAATESKRIAFRQVHQTDAARIAHQRRCTAEDRPVPNEEIAKGYELPDGRMEVLTDDDLADLPLPAARTIALAEFVPTEAIDPIFFDRSYYLAPEPAGTRAYVLLRDTLAKVDRLAVVTVALRQRESLAVLRAHGDVLLLTTMLWPDEVRTPEVGFLTAETPGSAPREQDMAEMLVKSLSTDVFDPGQYRDTYRHALEALIDAKLAGRQTAVPEPRVEQITDLETAVRRVSRRARRAGRVGQRGGDVKRIGAPPGRWWSGRKRSALGARRGRGRCVIPELRI